MIRKCVCSVGGGGKPHAQTILFQHGIGGLICAPLSPERRQTDMAETIRRFHQAVKTLIQAVIISHHEIRSGQKFLNSAGCLTCIGHESGSRKHITSPK